LGIYSKDFNTLLVFQALVQNLALEKFQGHSALFISCDTDLELIKKDLFVLLRRISLSILALSLMNQVWASKDWPLNDVSEIEVNHVISNVIDNFKAELDALNAPIRIQYKHADYIPDLMKSSAEISISTAWNESSQTFLPIINLNLSGAFTRFKSMTLDGVALIVCHEVGHLIGGGPTFESIHPDLGRALSAEGQADYFAASKCFKRYALNNPISSIYFNSTVSSNCQANFYKSDLDIEICVRSAMAGHIVLTTLNDINFLPGAPTSHFSFSRSSEFDQSIRNSTLLMHPDYQCRLDTYLAGALCGDKNTCVDPQNKRPKCWYVKDKSSTQSPNIKTKKFDGPEKYGPFYVLKPKNSSQQPNQKLRF
jgi:hypothetical protein